VIEAAEYELTRDAAGVADSSARGKLRVTGADAAEFLQGQVTNDVEALEPGTGCYSALLNHKGKVRTDMRVLRGEDWIWLDTEPGFQQLLESMVATYGIGRDVRAEDVSDAYAILSLVGPATDAGVDVICPAESAQAVREALGLEELSTEVAECLRIESGRPRFGVDFDSDTIPQEAGLNERAVSFDKGCYVGQETVARLHYKGRPNRHLRGLRLSGEAQPGAELRLGDRTVGALGSVAVSPVHGPIGLAIVRREAEPGDVLEVGDSGTTAELVELPF